MNKPRIAKMVAVLSGTEFWAVLHTYKISAMSDWEHAARCVKHGPAFLSRLSGLPEYIETRFVSEVVR